MFSRMLKHTIVLAMLMVFAVFPAGVLFSDEIDLANVTMPPVADFKCGDDLVETYKDSNGNEISGCGFFDADQSTCENASLTLEIKQSKGCTESAYGFECTVVYEDMGHGDVTCKWDTAEMTDGTGNPVTITSCSDSTYLETTSYRDCDHEEYR